MSAAASAFTRASPNPQGNQQKLLMGSRKTEKRKDQRQRKKCQSAPEAKLLAHVKALVPEETWEQKVKKGWEVINTVHSSPLLQDSSTPLDTYFELFEKELPAFSSTYRPTQSVAYHLTKLLDARPWTEEQKDEIKTHYKNVLTDQFNLIYGTDNDSLKSWQGLCTILDVRPMPEDVRTCRSRVKSLHINLVDLIDAHRTKKTIQKFPTEVELSKYTLGSGKFFPLMEARAGGLLKYLLRQILVPRKLEEEEGEGRAAGPRRREPGRHQRIQKTPY